jgi:hypothetical protein
MRSLSKLNVALGVLLLGGCTPTLWRVELHGLTPRGDETTLWNLETHESGISGYAPVASVRSTLSQTCTESVWAAGRSWARAHRFTVRPLQPSGHSVEVLLLHPPPEANGDLAYIVVVIAAPPGAAHPTLQIRYEGVDADAIVSENTIRRLDLYSLFEQLVVAAGACG